MAVGCSSSGLYRKKATVVLKNTCSVVLSEYTFYVDIIQHVCASMTENSPINVCVYGNVCVCVCDPGARSGWY